MPRKKKVAYKRDTQIAVYTPAPLLAKIKGEAVRRRRKLGPTVLEILREWFNQQESDYPKYADT